MYTHTHIRTQTAETETETDYNRYSVRQLKARLSKLNIDPDGFIEKSEMISRLKTEIRLNKQNIFTNKPKSKTTHPVFRTPTFATPQPKSPPKQRFQQPPKPRDIREDDDEVREKRVLCFLLDTFRCARATRAKVVPKTALP